MHLRETTPCSAGFKQNIRCVGLGKDSLRMIVIGSVVAVAMHRPGEIFFQTMAVAMLFDHSGVFGQDIEDGRCVRRGGLDRPDDQRQAQQSRHAVPQDRQESLCPLHPPAVVACSGA